MQELERRAAMQHQKEEEEDVYNHDETTLRTMNLAMENETAAEDEPQAAQYEQQAAEYEQQASEDEQQAVEHEQQASEDEQQAVEYEQQASEDEQQAVEYEQQASEDEQQTAEEEKEQQQTNEVQLSDVSTEMDFPTNYSHVQTTAAVTDAPLTKAPGRDRSASHFPKFGFFDMDMTHHMITSASRVHTMVVDEVLKYEEANFHCPLPFGFFADPQGNCSVYYACRAGSADRRVCPAHMHFNPVSKLCDYEYEALCGSKCPEMNGRFYLPGYCNKFLECNLGQPKIVKCPADLHYNAITKQCDAKTKAACEITCSPHHNPLVSLPGRCEMYASCLEGNATYHLCPYGLHFNPVLLRCDWPESAGCKIECPYPNGYFPVLHQCSSYIVCRNNHAKVESCPSHLHFNFLLHTCDLPSKARCNMECEKPNGFFPVPGVCSLYLMCLGGTPYLRKCPDDLEFNAATGQCAVVPKDHCLPHCPEDSGTFPVDDHCDLYIRCANGQPLVKRCPGNLHFNALFKQCDTPQRSLCELKCPYPTGVFPIPGKCDKFYRCENYTAYPHSCSEGLHFNARTHICDWPASARCEVTCLSEEGYAPIQGDCTAYVSCFRGRPALKTCPFGKHFNVIAKRCDLPKNANCVPKCQVDYNLFPLPGHCDSYLHCEDGMPHVDSCPPGLLFNDVTGMCDMPENVNCQSLS
ncbi:uncharacterized protein [Anabrus simplex]|uniref:uncharacterized protein isoform X2 n=1 Tax=Anabrus simplex TaxID=316456 RepID=UPI0035A2D7D4